MTPTTAEARHDPAEGIGSRLVVSLSHVTRADAVWVGHKAANLGELRQAGYPVPDGVVLTTRAWEPAGAVKDATIPEGLMSQLVEALRQFGERPLAVRSSGVAEDLPGRSYAGQYETVLDVRGEDALRRAVETCWSSAFSGRVAAYQGQTPHRPAAMAVLIQPMVPAEAAGVAFSANPVTGARDQVVINAVRGSTRGGRS